jgi:hypothetical protein
MFRLPSFNLSVASFVVSALMHGGPDVMLRDVFGTDRRDPPRAGASRPTLTQRHPGAGAAGMHRAWQRRRASGRV